MSLSTSHTHRRLLPALLFTLLFTFFLPSLVQAQATINSPASVTQCLPQQLTIAGGEPPYTITVLPGGSAGGAPLETLPTVEEAGSVRWIADVEAGQNITFSVRDNSGAENFSSQVPVLEGTETDCTNEGSTSGGGSAGGASGGGGSASAASATDSASSAASSGASGRSGSSGASGSATASARSGASGSSAASTSGGSSLATRLTPSSSGSASASASSASGSSPAHSWKKEKVGGLAAVGALVAALAA